MAERQFDNYAMKDGQTVLGERYFNPILQDIDNRIFALADIGERVDVAAAELIRAGLRRIDEFLLPAYENIASLAELGFLTATIQDDGPVTFELESKIVIINEGPERDQFRPSPYLTFQVGSDFRKVAVAISQTYVRETGALTVEFIDLSPELAADPGPHTGIYISAAAGSTIATLNAVESVQDDREAAESASATAVSARDTAVSAKVAAEGARDTAKATVQSQLGAYDFGSFPTARLDGSALQAGDKLYDLTNKFERVYDGSTGFVPVVTVSIGGVTITPGTFAGGSNVITIAGGFSDALVWVNGVLLIKDDDYTAASPTITVPGVANGDNYVVWSFKAMAATDYATKEELTTGLASKADAGSVATALASKATKLTWSKKTASFTAAAGNIYLVKHTAAVTVTFPATVAEGDRIGLIIEDEAETYTVTIALSGKSFAGSTSDVAIKRGVTLIFEFYDSAWRLSA